MLRQFKRILPRQIRQNLRLISPRNWQHGVDGLTTNWRHLLGNGRIMPVETLTRLNFSHVAYFTVGNAGDTLLTVVLRDLISSQFPRHQWHNHHLHDRLTKTRIAALNDTNAVFLGGGGLFLRDTAPNNRSGWQWPVENTEVRSLTTPLIVFAIGHKGFRNLELIDPTFRDSVINLVEHARFIGLRNYGSVYALRDMLPEELREKVKFQPCMTTLLRHIYPYVKARTDLPPENFIALNCALDRPERRFGSRTDEVLAAIAEAAAQLGRERPVRYYAHTPQDDEFVPYLRRAGTKFEYVRLYNRPPEYVLNHYMTPALTLGMRGHAQLIPFGCGRPILSLCSHDEMNWFLDDIESPDLGIDVMQPNLAATLVEKAESVLRDQKAITARLLHQQDRMWAVTQENLTEIAGIVSRG